MKTRVIKMEMSYIEGAMYPYLFSPAQYKPKPKIGAIEIPPAIGKTPEEAVDNFCTAWLKLRLMHKTFSVPIQQTLDMGENNAD